MKSQYDFECSEKHFNLTPEEFLHLESINQKKYNSWILCLPSCFTNLGTSESE